MYLKLGTLKGAKATIHVKRNAPPSFTRRRSVTFAVRTKVDEANDRLLEVDVMKYGE